MIVLHIIKSLGRGGAEMLLPETLKLHNKNYFEFHYLYFLSWKDQMVESLENEGGKVTCFASKNNIELILKARRIATYVKKNNIQLIHAHLPWAGIVARIVGKLTGVPIIYTEHNKQERYHVATRWMNLATMNWLDRVIAVSADVEESIRKHKPGLQIPAQTILNGVNTQRFAPGMFAKETVREELNIPSDAFVIGTVAVFRFQKRLDVWIEIARKLMKQLPNVHFIIVGDGPLKQLLLKKKDELQMDGYLHFVGVKTEVRPYLATFDLFMMSSIFEGLPIALLEAMASGCAVVATDAGGVKEVVRHSVDGFLCDVNEPERLVELASSLLHDRDKRKEMGLNGRKRIEDLFSMDKMVRELEGVYHQMLKLK